MTPTKTGPKKDRRINPKSKIDLGEKRSGRERREDIDFRQQVEIHFKYYASCTTKEIAEIILKEELLPELSATGILDAQLTNKSLKSEAQFLKLQSVRILDRLAYKLYQYSFWHAKINDDELKIKRFVANLAKEDANKLTLKTQQQFAKWLIKQKKWSPIQRNIIINFSHAA